MSSSFGKKYVTTVYGTSHGPLIGVRIEGFPRGMRVDPDELKKFMDRRRPGNSSLKSARKETDEIRFVSGLSDGVTNGDVICMEIDNEDVRSKDYEELKGIVRPGHADYAVYQKYGTDYDLAGGGEFSGRMTAMYCAAGYLFLELLRQNGIKVEAVIKSVGGREIITEIAALVNDVKNEGDSVGGIVECTIDGIPAGFGGAMFDGVEALLSEAVFAIPAVKGVAFGSGFRAAAMKGSENNDEVEIKDGRAVLKTNNCGGILGGIATGTPINFEVAFKPTPSIAKKQHTVDLNKMEECDIEIKGRHDPCIVLRATPIVEAVTAMALCEHMDLKVQEYVNRRTSIEALRSRIDRVDRELLSLFEKRMEISSEIAAYKLENGLPVLDAGREKEKLRQIRELAGDEYADYADELFEKLMELSRRKQEEYDRIHNK